MTRGDRYFTRAPLVDRIQHFGQSAFGAWKSLCCNLPLHQYRLCLESRRTTGSRRERRTSTDCRCTRPRLSSSCAGRRCRRGCAARKAQRSKLFCKLRARLFASFSRAYFTSKTSGASNTSDVQICARRRDRRVCALDSPQVHSEQLQAAGRTAPRLGCQAKGVRRAAIRRRTSRIAAVLGWRRRAKRRRGHDASHTGLDIID